MMMFTGFVVWLAFTTFALTAQALGGWIICETIAPASCVGKNRRMPVAYAIGLVTALFVAFVALTSAALP